MKKQLYKITVLVAAGGNIFSQNFYKFNNEDFNIKLLEQITKTIASNATKEEYDEWHLQHIDIKKSY